MTEDEKAHYEEWKKKCAETRKRKSRELAEVQAETMEENPGYRLITRGPNKGKLNWLGYQQQRMDRSSIAWAKRRKADEERRKLEPPELQKPIVLEPPKPSPKFSPEVFLAFAVIMTLWLISFFIMKALASFGILGVCALIDAVCYAAKGKRRRHSRYLPFLWWFE